MRACHEEVIPSTSFLHEKLVFPVCWLLSDVSNFLLYSTWILIMEILLYAPSTIADDQLLQLYVLNYSISFIISETACYNRLSFLAWVRWLLLPSSPSTFWLYVGLSSPGPEWCLSPSPCQNHQSLEPQLDPGSWAGTDDRTLQQYPCNKDTISVCEIYLWFHIEIDHHRKCRAVYEC